MKKNITTFLMAVMLALAIPAMATSSYAQTRNYNGQYQQASGYYDQYGNYHSYARPNVYRRHRKAMNIAIATGAGAIIGALLGGKKGALIGAGAGVGTGLIVNHQQSKKYYYRRY